MPLGWPLPSVMLRPTVLIVSDHPLVFDRVRSMLEPSFDTLALMAPPESVVAAVSALEPMILVVDAASPSLKGQDLVERVREELPEQRLIALVEEASASERASSPEVPRAEGVMALSPKIREVMGGGAARLEPSPAEATSWIRRYNRRYSSPPERCCDR